MLDLLIANYGFKHELNGVVKTVTCPTYKHHILYVSVEKNGNFYKYWFWSKLYETKVSIYNIDDFLFYYNSDMDTFKDMLSSALQEINKCYKS